MFTSLFRTSADRSPGSDFWFQPVGAASASGMRVDAATAMRLTAVYACVRVISESFATLPFALYKPRKDRGRDQVRRHWLTQLFNVRPNRWQDPFQWREMVQSHLTLRGTAFNRIVDDGRGGIAELLPMHPDRMRIETLDNGSWRYRYTEANGSETVLRRDQVWKLTGLTDNGLVGISPIEMQRDAIGGALAAQSYSSRFFANDARPTSGWLEIPGKFADADAKRTFRRQFAEQQSGVNRGKMLMLDMGMKYHELGMTNEDAQTLETLQAGVPMIARIFRVPPHKIGDLTRSTNNNIEHQSLEFWQDCMLPWTSRWAAAIRADLLGDDSDLEPDFDFDQLLLADSKTRAEYYHGMVLDGILTRNEARDGLRYNPLPGLDEPLVPVNERDASAPPPAPAQPSSAPRPADDASPTDDEASRD